MVGDFSLAGQIEILLEKISQVAAAAHVPFVASAYAKLFDLGDFDALHKPRDLQIFESAELIKWRNFRESEDSRYVTLLPKVMMRFIAVPKIQLLGWFLMSRSVEPSTS